MSVQQSNAELAALLLAIHPEGLRGAVLRGKSAEACERWIRHFIGLMPPTAPVRRIPVSITEERLLGGLDFGATIAAGKAVAERGVLAAANEGIVVVPAPGTRATTWSHLARALDNEAVIVERDGLRAVHPAHFVLLASQHAMDDTVPASVEDRVAFIVDVTTEAMNSVTSRIDAVRSARALMPNVFLPDEMIAAVCEGADALGVSPSARVMSAALSAARANAALVGRDVVSAADIACAAALVLAPRATRAPADEQSSPDNAGPAEASPTSSQTGVPTHSGEGESNTPDSKDARELAEVVVRAAHAAIPAGLLAASAARSARSSGTAGRAGAEQQGVRGRQTGSRRGRPGGGARLDLVATLRAAAPMQRIRRARTAQSQRLVHLRPDDFRVRRCVTPSTTTTVFVVDASGSSALHRLGELKGALDLMLAEGYARRERVAVIAFRGTCASLVLAPTHALARARRAVAGMPAGGGTPLAGAIDLAAQVVVAARRDASQVVTVLLSDGRANVTRAGTGGRAQAQADALDAGRRLAQLGGDVVFVDTAARPEPFARQLADALSARYVPLPSPTSAAVRGAALGARAEPASARG